MDDWAWIYGDDNWDGFTYYPEWDTWDDADILSGFESTGLWGPYDASGYLDFDVDVMTEADLDLLDALDAAGATNWDFVTANWSTPDVWTYGTDWNSTNFWDNEIIGEGLVTDLDWIGALIRLTDIAGSGGADLVNQFIENTGGTGDALGRLLSTTGGSGGSGGNSMGNLLGLASMLAQIFGGNEQEKSETKWFNYPDWATDAYKAVWGSDGMLENYPFEPTGDLGTGYMGYDFAPGFTTMPSTMDDLLNRYTGPRTYNQSGYWATGRNVLDDTINRYGGNLNNALSEYYGTGRNYIDDTANPYRGDLTVNPDWRRHQLWRDLMDYNPIFEGDTELDWSRFFDDANIVGEEDMSKVLSDLYDFTGSGELNIRDVDLDPYMNPYIKAVLDPQIERLMDKYAQDWQDLARREGMVNAFGDDRSLIMGQLLNESQDLAIDEATANAYKDAWDNAMSSARYDVGNRLSTLQNLPNAQNILADLYMSLGREDMDMQQQSIENALAAFGDSREGQEYVFNMMRDLALDAEDIQEGNIKRAYEEYTRQMDARDNIADYYFKWAQAQDENDIGNIERNYDEFERQMLAREDLAQYYQDWGASADEIAQWNTKNQIDLWNQENQNRLDYGNWYMDWAEAEMRQNEEFNNDYWDWWKWDQEFPQNAWQTYGSIFSNFIPNNIGYTTVHTPEEANQWARLFSGLGSWVNDQGADWSFSDMFTDIFSGDLDFSGFNFSGDSTNTNDEDDTIY